MMSIATGNGMTNSAGVRVWGRPNSANVQKVLWCLEDLNVDHDSIPAGGEHGGLDTAEFLELNPNQLVPVLVDDGVALWESNVVVRYLCKRYGRDIAFHSDPLQQALQERWVDWYGTELGAHMTALWGHFKRGKALPTDVLESRLGRATHLWSILDRSLVAITFIGGSEPGAGDYSLGPAVHRWVSISESSVAPNLLRWHRSLSARPGFQQHVIAAPL